MTSATGPAGGGASVPIDPDDAPGPLHRRPWALGLVFVGGAVGTYARYGLAVAYPTEPERFPVGTFVANVVGAFVLGLLLESLARRGDDTGARRRLRLLLGTGFCGGFTTYSTFAVESALLLRDHCWGRAVGYLAATLVLGAAATVAGIVAATRAVRRAP